MEQIKTDEFAALNFTRVLISVRLIAVIMIRSGSANSLSLIDPNKKRKADNPYKDHRLPSY